MRRILKALIRFIFVAVPVILLAGGAGLFWLVRSLPPASGSMTVEGLSGPVTISRDPRGVPHIVGSTLEDTLTGLGFAHAQDRLWQMEVSRIAAQGRLSEIFGEPTIDSDIWLRSMGIFEASETSYQDMPEAGQRALQAYTAGVNAWLDREGRTFASRLPPEFVLLGHTPEPWKPEHSVASIKMMSVTLGANARDEVMRLAFARLGLTSQDMSDLLPPNPNDDPPPLPDMASLLGLDTGPLQPVSENQQAGGPFLPIDLSAPRGASNNWVVSGDRTSTGGPIVANDPHLGLTAPSIWYLAHVRVTDGNGSHDLVGATLAGTPLVLLGRNNSIAWGFTNTGTDVQDIFVERVNPDNPDEYLTPDGWERFGSREETIRLRGGGEHRFTRRWTRHGPVLPESYLNIGAYLPDGTVAALQWVALARDDNTLMSGINVWDADTVTAFQQAMIDYMTPMQSMVVADGSGNIGMIAPGRVPIRDPENRVMGRAPVPGWNSLFDWQSTIPFSGLPRLTNPPDGAIETANAKMVGPDYPYLLTYDWEEPWRQERLIKLVVDSTDKQSLASTRDIQADVYSTGFAAIGPGMLQLVEERNDVNADIIAQLKDWDYEMQRDSALPLVFMAWFRESMIGIFKDDLGPAFDLWFKARGLVMQRILSRETARDWCDDRSTAGTETCADILAASLNRALVDLERRYGNDREEWRWGVAHLTAGQHTPFSNVPVLRNFFDVQVESAGGPFTIDRGGTTLSSATTPFINVNGSSFRGIYDMADLEKSTYMITTGQSGNVFSRHYRDLAEPWSNVEAFVIPTDPQAYEPTVVGSWQLLPQ